MQCQDLKSWLSCMSTVSKLQNDHPRLARIVQKQSFKISKTHAGTSWLLRITAAENHANTNHGCWGSQDDIVLADASRCVAGIRLGENDSEIAVFSDSH